MLFVSEESQVPITGIEFSEQNISLSVNEEKTITISTTPAQANTPDVSFTSGNNSYLTVTKVDNRTVKLTGKGAGTTYVKATAGNVNTQINVTVSASE